MSDQDKRIVAAALAGALLGGFFTVFVIYPPHAHWNDDLKLGDVATWLSAFATVAAVIAALNGSKRAIQAERELRADDARRAEEARQLQKSIMAGLCQVTLFNLISDCKRASLVLRNHSFPTVVCLGAIERLGISQLERACERLDLFDRAEGIELGHVTLIAREMIESTRNQHESLVQLKGAARDEEREFLAHTCCEIIKLANPLYGHFLQLAGLSVPDVLPETLGQSHYDRLISLKQER